MERRDYARVNARTVSSRVGGWPRGFDPGFATIEGVAVAIPACKLGAL